MVHIWSDEHEHVDTFFDIIYKGSEEWYLVLDRSKVESSEHPKGKEILKSVKSIGDFLVKACGDEETSKRIREEVWDMIWVW